MGKSEFTHDLNKVKVKSTVTIKASCKFKTPTTNLGTLNSVEKKIPP